MPEKSKKPQASWPADRVERRPVSVLIPDARNTRTHSATQVAQLAASIKEWGWTVRVLVDEAGGIIAGHGCVLAARKLKIADVPVMVAAGWTEGQKRAYALADNQLALNADWDDDLLNAEIAALKDLDFDLELTGLRHANRRFPRHIPPLESHQKTESQQLSVGPPKQTCLALIMIFEPGKALKFRNQEFIDK
jgi:hypothetical protein